MIKRRGRENNKKVMEFYRFVVGHNSVGIYEAVDRDCSKDDLKRHSKPDGSWLLKVGTKFPGAISFWTTEGLAKYVDSGLQSWHSSVVREPIFVLVVSNIEKHLYQDEFQIICMPETVSIENRFKLKEFFASK